MQRDIDSYFGGATYGDYLAEKAPFLVHLLEAFAAVFEVCALIVMVIGAARFMLRFCVAEVTRDGEARMRRTNVARIETGGYILSGLALLIVSDLIHTAVSFSISELIFLAVLVAIRSVVGLFLEREIRALKLEQMR